MIDENVINFQMEEQYRDGRNFSQFLRATPGEAIRLEGEDPFRALNRLEEMQREAIARRAEAMMLLRDAEARRVTANPGRTEPAIDWVPMPTAAEVATGRAGGTNVETEATLDTIYENTIWEDPIPVAREKKSATPEQNWEAPYFDKDGHYVSPHLDKDVGQIIRGKFCSRHDKQKGKTPVFFGGVPARPEVQHRPADAFAADVAATTVAYARPMTATTLATAYARTQPVTE